jgi:hypothetical protein
VQVRQLEPAGHACPQAAAYVLHRPASQNAAAVAGAVMRDPSSVLSRLSAHPQGGKLARHCVSRLANRCCSET